MKQARVPTEPEVKRLLAVIQQGRYGARNRMAIMLSYYAGMRVGEIAQLRWGDMLDGQGMVREQIRLRCEITKGGHARTVFVGDKLRKEFDRYRMSRVTTIRPAETLLRTQKRTAFSPNTLCQLFSQLYKQAGMDGASSHSGQRWFITRLAHSAVSPKVIMTFPSCTGGRRPHMVPASQRA